MAYVSIKEANDDRLHFAREPTARAWAILVGLLSLGLGAAYYSGDYLLWKLAYVSGSVFVGLTCMEDWEECVLDKTSKKVTIKKQSLIQKIFQTEEGQKLVVADLDDLTSVAVQEEEVKYSGTGYIVVLHFGAGFSLGVTETTTIGDKSEQDYIREKIHVFLELDNKKKSSISDDADVVSDEVAMDTKEEEQYPSDNVENISMETKLSAELLADDESSTDESDDSFVQVDKADFINEVPIELTDQDQQQTEVTPDASQEISSAPQHTETQEDQ